MATAAMIAFVCVHLLDLVLGVGVALALPSAALAMLSWRELDRYGPGPWPDASSSSARRATRAT